MSRIQQRISEIERLIASGQAERAEEAASALMALYRRDPAVWIARGHARLELRRLSQAESDFAQALRLAPSNRRAIVMRAMALHEMNRPDEAIELVRRLVAFGGPEAEDASLMLASILNWAGRGDELAEFVDRGGSWLSNPRAVTFRAQVLAKRDMPAAIAMLLEVVDGDAPVELRRVVGFQAVVLLDRAGRFREAFDLATRLHRATGGQFDLPAVRAHVESQRDAILRGSARIQPAAPSVPGLAMVVALPRSGTTLLEQMLDCHPQVAGIGEHAGLNGIGTSLRAAGAWHDGVAAPDGALARRLQEQYLAGARDRARPGARCLVDKTLAAWMWMPAVAAVLPGTACFHVSRDPRDLAVSQYLGVFETNAFNQSMESIREFIALERSILPRMLAALGLRHEAIVYEDMVADPRAVAVRCLGLLGLPMDEAVLAPERNRRLVYTLSNEQVRRSINSSSIGRWKNYEFAFDCSWDELVVQHEARRARATHAAGLDSQTA